MNTRFNQQYLQTESQIKTIFISLMKEKPFNKITVSELCKLADINRKTFYKHYLDIYDLMDKMEMEMGRNLTETLIRQDTPTLGDGFCRLFCYIKENMDFYKIYLNNNSELKVVDAVLSEGQRAREREIAKKLGFKDEKEYTYHSSFFKAGLTAIIKLWINDGCRETPQELSEVIAKEYSPRTDLFKWF